VPVNGVRSASYALASRGKTARYRVYSIRRPVSNGGARPELWKSESFTWSPSKKVFEREAVL
jgi:hypothetical protein